MITKLKKIKKTLKFCPSQGLFNDKIELILLL